MKYILMLSATKADYEWYTKWSKEDLQAQAAFMDTFNKELKDSGVLVAFQGLAAPARAKVVRADKNGEPITDGVFPESKEFLAGFWIVDVDSAEQAYALAARFSAGPGCKERGNARIEVRPIPSGPPPEIPVTGQAAANAAL